MKQNEGKMPKVMVVNGFRLEEQDNGEIRVTDPDGEFYGTFSSRAAVMLSIR